MENKIEITKEMLLAARDYVPLAEKEKWIEENAPKCFDKLAITADGESMPPMFSVNSGLKSRYLMGAFAWLYMRARKNRVEPSDEWLMHSEEYDLWAGSHVFNQIERWKRDAELRDKCFDLLSDYRDLEKRFSAQINSLLAVQNDSVLRQSEYMAAQMRDLPGMLEQIQAMQEKADSHGGEAASE